MRYYIKTLGCQMNYSDSERVARVLTASGFSETKDPKSADIFVINTCSVRQTSENKAIGQIRNQKQKFPNSVIAVTGCMVRQTGDKTTSKDALLKNPFIDIVFRIEDTVKLPKILESHFPNHDFENFFRQFGSGSVENYFQITPKVKNHTQVFVPIMQGCDKFCAYCIVPHTRGREISRPVKDIFEECEKLVDRGAKEITLLGQNVNSYTDGGNSRHEKCFPKLLKKINTLHKKGLSRLRFTSPHPQDFTDELIETLKTLKTACPHIHLPLQHGDDEILKAMNRNYTAKHYRSIIEKIRTHIPDCMITTDLIVGFPGETEKAFDNLCKFVEEIGFSFSFTAIYSPRKNTPAEKMKDRFIPDKIKKERFHRLDKIIKNKAFELRKKSVGKTLEVLVETSVPTKDGTFQNTGRSREFFEVWFPSSRPMKGKEVMVKIISAQDYTLSGKPVSPEKSSSLPVIYE